MSFGVVVWRITGAKHNGKEVDGKSVLELNDSRPSGRVNGADLD
jgi:hypothetical protein